MAEKSEKMPEVKSAVTSHRELVYANKMVDDQFLKRRELEALENDPQAVGGRTNLSAMLDVIDKKRGKR